jgi:hypothetical protein
MKKIFIIIISLLLNATCNPSEKMIYVSSNGTIEGQEKNELYYWPDKMTNLNEALVEWVRLKHLIEIIEKKLNRWT